MPLTTALRLFHGDRELLGDLAEQFDLRRADNMLHDEMVQQAQRELMEYLKPENGSQNSEAIGSNDGARSLNFGTLADAEREHIINVLRESGWVLGGASGAAARLATAKR